MNRYLPPAVKAAETQLELATERLQLAANKAWTGFLTEFGGWYAPMRAAVAALAALDCLHSLAAVAANAGCAPLGCESVLLCIIRLPILMTMAASKRLRAGPWPRSQRWTAWWQQSPGALTDSCLSALVGYKLSLQSRRSL